MYKKALPILIVSLKKLLYRLNLVLNIALYIILIRLYLG